MGMFIYPEVDKILTDNGDVIDPHLDQFTNDQRVSDKRTSSGIDLMNKKLDRIIHLLEVMTN